MRIPMILCQARAWAPLAALLLAACSSSPFKRADHDVAWVTVPGVGDRMLVAGGTRDGTVPLDTAIAWTSQTQRYQVIGTMSGLRGWARLAPHRTGGRLDGVMLIGGDTFFVDYYLEARCSMQRVIRLKRQRLRDFAVARTPTGPIVIGGATAFADHNGDPDLINATGSSDTSAEILWQTGLELSKFPHECASAVGPASGTALQIGGTREVHMKVSRAGHTATAVAGWADRVLVVGGSFTDRRAEAYNPASGAFEDAGSLWQPRRFHTATKVAGDHILIAGGRVDDGTGDAPPTATAELWDRTIQVFIPLSPMATARSNHAAVLLDDGRVLLIGGRGPGGEFLSSSEFFDPATRTFSRGPTLRHARSNHAAIHRYGNVYVTGGTGPDGTVEEIEHFATFLPNQFFAVQDPVLGP